jgi:hypothetical protein
MNSARRFTGSASRLRSSDAPRQPAYWELPHVAGKPIALAVQDFRAPGSPRFLAPIPTEYVFGVRHRQREDGTGAPEAE